MNQVTTKMPTNITATKATLNATIDNTDNDLVIYGFVYKEGTSGDPRVTDEGIQTQSNFGNPNVGDYSFSVATLKSNTTYRVVAAIGYLDPGIVFAYGETIQINTTELVVPEVKIEGIPWDGLILPIGADKEFPDFSSAVTYANSQNEPTVMLIYDNEWCSTHVCHDISKRFYIRGIDNGLKLNINSPLFRSMSDDPVEGGGFIDNLDLETSGGWRTFEFFGGIIRCNKIRIKSTYDGDVLSSLIESCGVKTLQLTNVTLDTNKNHVDMLGAIESGSYFDKVAYNAPWVGNLPENPDMAVIGTTGYGYEYGTAGLLIEVAETPAPPSTGKRVMIRKS